MESERTCFRSACRPSGSQCMSLRMQRKGKEEYLYSVIYTMHSLKAHSFTCKLHHACLTFVSVHQMAPPLTEVTDIHLHLTTHLSTLAELAWLVDLYSGRFIRINGHPSATGRTQDRESLPAKDRRSIAVPPNQPKETFYSFTVYD